MTPKAHTEIGGRKPSDHMGDRDSNAADLQSERPAECEELDGTSFPYWEGPIGFAGSHTGVGYLEMTGY